MEKVKIQYNLLEEETKNTREKLDASYTESFDTHRFFAFPTSRKYVKCNKSPTVLKILSLKNSPCPDRVPKKSFNGKH